MTTQELRNEILEIIDEMPDNALLQIFNYLEATKQSLQNDELDLFVRNTLIEDKELLFRLSQ